MKIYVYLKQNIKDIYLLFIFIFLSGVISILLGQDANWDLKNYHLYNAFSFIEDRLLFDYGTAIQWYLNPILDLPYYFFIKFFYSYPKLIAFLQGTYAGILLFILYKLSALIMPINNKFYRALVVISVFGAASGSILISEWGTTFNDIQISLLILFALYLIVKGLANQKFNIRIIFISFYIIGIAVGFKLTSAIYLVGTFLSLLIISDNKIRLVFYSFFGTLLGGITSGGYWSYKMFSIFNNPIFPFYNHIFKSDWFVIISGSDCRWFPESTFEWIFYPVYWMIKNHSIVTEVDFADSRVFFGLFFSSLILVISIKSKIEKPFYFIILFYFITYIAWIVMFSYYRYILLLEVLSIFIIVKCIYILLKPKYSFKFSIFLGLIIIFMTVPANWGRVSFSNNYIEYILPEIPSNSIIIAKDQDPPRSYLFLLFSNKNRFILLGDSTEKETKLAEVVNNTLINSSGKIYFIAQSSIFQNELNEIQNKYGLKSINNQCQPIYTSLEKNKYVLCEVYNNEK